MRTKAEITQIIKREAFFFSFLIFSRGKDNVWVTSSSGEHCYSVGLRLLLLKETNTATPTQAE